MKRVYKHIRFNHGESGVWWCNSKHDDFLGCVTYYKDWSQFVFNPQPETMFSASCLGDISHFLAQLNGEKKDKNA